LVTGIGLAHAFLVDIADFIKKDRYIEIGKYLKKHFFSIWKPEQPWENLNTKQKALHIASCTAKCVIRGLFLTVGAAAWAVATIASAPFFAGKGFNVLTSVFKIGAQPSQIITNITMYGLGTPVNSFFYAKGIFNTASKAADVAIATGAAVIKAVTHPVETWNTIKNTWKNLRANKTRIAAVVTSTVKRSILLGSTVSNAYGYSHGPASSAGSIALIQNLLSLPINIVKNLIQSAASIASGGPNTIASVKASSQEKAVKADVNTEEDAYRKFKLNEGKKCLSYFFGPVPKEGVEKNEVEIDLESARESALKL
jgi:hypothetical protein